MDGTTAVRGRVQRRAAGPDGRRLPLRRCALGGALQGDFREMIAGIVREEIGRLLNAVK